MLNEQVLVNEDGEIKCICMNEPSWDGFSACHRNGQVDDNLLSKHNVDSVYYLCERCGRIINEKTLEVVAVLQSDEDNFDDLFAAAVAMQERAHRMAQQAMEEKPWNVEEMMGDLSSIERLLVCLQKVKLRELETF
jgi:hypothetical protein